MGSLGFGVGPHLPLRLHRGYWLGCLTETIRIVLTVSYSVKTWKKSKGIEPGLLLSGQTLLTTELPERGAETYVLIQSCHSTVESEWVGTGWIGASHTLLRLLTTELPELGGQRR